MELIQQQAANSNDFQQAIKNFKKSPADRKTSDYLERQLSKITQLWEKINKVDGLIRKNNSIPETHEYYSSNLYEKLGEMYQDISTKIQEEINSMKGTSAQALFPKQKGIVMTPLNPTVSKLPVKMQKGINAVKQLILKTDEDGQRGEQFLAMQLRTIEQHWKLMQKLHEQLWTAVNDDYDIDEFLQQEAIINDGILQLTDRIKSLEVTPASCSKKTSSNDVKLPTIELPVFDGNSLKWRQYKDLFMELVHCQQLSGCQKLWYLKSSLTGEAARLIQHLSTTSENYVSAWQIINNRYENKRLLVGKMLQRLLSQSPTQKESSASIKSLHDTSLECLLGLKAMGLDTDNWDPIIVHLLTQLLDRSTQLQWEQSLSDPRELPKLQDLMKFLESRFQSMEAVGPSRKIAQTSSNSLITAISSCIACNQPHEPYQCHKFKNMTTKQRLNLIQNNNFCVNCLKSDHAAKQCPSTRNCRQCNKRHHTLLHLDSQKSRKDYPTPSSPISKKTESTTSVKPVIASALIAATQKEKSAVLLSTVLILVDDAYGQQVECRAILDNGSQVHLITQEFANKLGIPELDHQLRIQGIGETHRNTSKRVNIQIASKVTSYTGRIEALVIPKIVTQQPRNYIQTQKWKIPKNIILGDPRFNIPGDVDMLIGAGVFYSILSVGQIKLGKGMPLLQNTVLGWVLGGEHPVEADPKEQLVCGMCTEEELLSSMEKFWEIEECSTIPRSMTTAELKCETYFANTHKRDSDQRFVVKLPFREDAKALGQSYGIALQRLRSVEKRLSKDKILQQEYIKFMQEYQNLGHMKEITEAQITGTHYFLPHHAVIKPDSTTTKVRVVFDASAKTSSNVSLNDILAIGPTIQDDVFTELLRFRFPRYAFTADIEKMYRQIWVHKDDRKFQLILWRENPEQPVKFFQLNTITYGTSCAPYLATRCLQQLAHESTVTHPLASKILSKNFYVDDVLAGSDNISTAVDQIHQLREVLITAGLNLRKWCSNDQRLLNQVPEADRELNLELNQSGSDSVKTMGLIWTPKEDCFAIRTKVIIGKRVTKRTALAEISQIFDPLGFIAPVTITAKIFLQKLWKLKVDWDAAVPQDLHTEWVNFRNEFEQLNQIKVARHSFGHEKPRTMQIHIFADASERAYGVVAYVRSISKNDAIIIRFLCAKSKVAPTKQTTLPRLELCAAKLATDLMKRIQTDLEMDKNCFHLWSDSTAVLGWINAESSNYHTFVANRIASIQRISTVKQWHYIQSQDNPADLISRGLFPRQLVNNNFWFYGPKFLHGRDDIWSNTNLNVDCSLEMRQKAKITLAVWHSVDDVISQIKHQNSFRRLQRIVAYMFRFSKPRLPGAGFLGKANLVVRPTELELALHSIVKSMQRSEFQHHINDLLKHNAVQHTSSIAHLAPFLDNKGIIRVGGRLNSADISYDAKHPILLSHKHPLSKLLLTDIHKENMHAAVQTLLAISRQKFWIINGKTLARNIVHNCVHCTRVKPKLAEQIMGHLPRDRVSAARPFFIAGIDFFGPVYIHFKGRGKHPTKAYVAVFCCFSTKAVHLEMVSDLSTEAFIGALKRFIGRRGRCQKIYCDNATNFVGAKNALAEMSSIIHNEDAKNKILSLCSKNSIEFCFIPPRAPHFGGLWEAAVKSAKGLLQATLAAASLTYEEMETVIIDAEAILNSRPLTPMSNDPNDMSALTPGHFLIGEPLTAIADPHQSTAKISSLARWNLVRHLKNEFWRRWSLEYLTGLQHRYKWKKECENIKCGTMVVIKDDNLPPLKWALGRIEQIITGPDGRVRVADVRTANNVSRRPIHKLAPLPIEEMEQPSEATNEVEAQQPTTSSKVKTSSKRKRKAASSIATLLLTCLVLPFTSASVEFSPFEGEPGIYFERIGMTNLIASSWNLINFVDLRPFHRETELANNYVNTLIGICKALKSTSECGKTIDQIQHQLQMIETNSQLLRFNHRTRRGALNFVGNVAGALFGLLDSEYAEKLSNTIDNLKTNDEVLKHYAENQTMFLDRTLSIMKKNQEQIKGEFEAFESFIKRTEMTISKITHETHQEQLATTFNTLALQAFMQSIRFQSVQNAIIDIITDAHHGKLSPELLTPKEFQVELRAIHSQNTKSLRLPLSIDDISQYYRLMSISHQITENYVIFKIEIPLTTSKKFELLKLTAIPWLTNYTLYKLQLSAQYLIVDLLREHYFPMSSEEVQECTSINSAHFLCPQSQPMHNHNSSASHCELSILRASKATSNCHPITCGNDTYWKALHAPNTWLYAVSSNELVNIVCNSTPSQTEIRGSGILTIENGCIMKTPKVTIEGQEVITRTRQIVYVPTCNFSQLQFNTEQTVYNHSVISHKFNDDIFNLQNDLHNFKTISLNTIRPHDIHHYGLGYTIVIILICLVIYVVATYWKRSHVGRLPVPAPQPAPRINTAARIPDQDAESQAVGSQIISMFS